MGKSFKELEKESNDADMIIPGLFLGSQDAAEDYNFLKKHNISVVINASNHIPCFHRSKKITYIRVPVDDSLKNYDINKMTAYLPYIIETLRFFHHTMKRNVLVHCAAGVQRSAIIVASYLVKYYNKTPMGAIKFIIKRRPIAFHNGQSLNFIDSLNNFHNNIKRFNVNKSLSGIKPIHPPVLSTKIPVKIPAKKSRSSSKKSSNSSNSSKKSSKKKSYRKIRIT